jgi:hypothetical protein
MMFEAGRIFNFIGFSDPINKIYSMEGYVENLSLLVFYFNNYRYFW